MDETRYRIDILESTLGPWLDSLQPAARARLIFMQDGARPHWGASCLAWFRARGIEVIDNWPPAHSPDLNPIELLWAPLKAMVNKIDGRAAGGNLPAMTRSFFAV